MTLGQCAKVAVASALSPIWVPLLALTIPVAVIVVLPGHIPYIYRKISRSRPVNEMKQKRKNKKPKAVNRKRRMTFDASQPRFSMQMESSFFQKLPPELRHMSYEHVARQELHIVLVAGKIRSFSIPRPLPEYVILDQDTLAGAGCLGILQSCRRMYVLCILKLNTSPSHRKTYNKYAQLTLRRYTEASGIAYSTPLFRFQNYDSFFAFTSTILPERFNAIRLLQIGGSDYRLGPGGLYKLDFDESTLNYKSLRRLSYRNPVLPNGPTIREDFSAFSAACFVITQMAGLEKLSMELDHCATSTEPRMVHMVRRNMEERVMPALEGLRELGLRRFDVRFARVTLYTMGWTRQPFEDGVRLKADEGGVAT
jgi:hypothetical protein